METFDQLAYVFVECGFASEAYGCVFWGLGFFEFLFVCFGVGFVACEDLVLGFDAFFYYLFWLVPLWKFGFVPSCFEVCGLGSPAE